MWSVFLTFLRLGLTSFGGPIAHLGYFRTEFVDRKKWLGATEYADLVSLCQFIPGPASSQVGLAVGLRRAGLRGAVAAWCGFTLPSAIVLVAFAVGLAGRVPDEVLHGLMLVAVAVVAQALLQMGRTALRGVVDVVVAGAALGAALLWPTAWLQIVIVAAAALVGVAVFGRRPAPEANRPEPMTGAAVRRSAPRRTGVIALGIGAALLVVLPLLAAATDVLAIRVADVFYRVGSMVFGGGHVVLPLLELQVVAPGWVSAGDFIAGYGAAQAVPGPLFTFSAYLGASMSSPYLMATIALVAIFLPSFFMVVGVMPFWDQLRHNSAVRAALRGVNASVIGILGAAFWNPIITSAVHTWVDVAIAAAGFAALVWLKAPPWLVVVVMAGLAWLVV